jgi:hypothetical protein
MYTDQPCGAWFRQSRGSLEDSRDLTRLVPDWGLTEKQVLAGGQALNINGERGSMKETRRCHYCDKKGHLKKDCKLRMRRDKRANLNGHVAHAMMTRTSNNEANIILDSGASHHIITDEGQLSKLSQSDVKVVRLGGNEDHIVEGEGEARLCGGPDGDVVLRGALYVPTMRINLLSGVRATEAGFVCQQQGDICCIKRSNKTVLAGQKQGGLY